MTTTGWDIYGRWTTREEAAEAATFARQVLRRAARVRADAGFFYVDLGRGLRREP